MTKPSGDLGSAGSRGMGPYCALLAVETVSMSWLGNLPASGRACEKQQGLPEASGRSLYLRPTFLFFATLAYAVVLKQNPGGAARNYGQARP